MKHLSRRMSGCTHLRHIWKEILCFFFYSGVPDICALSLRELASSSTKSLGTCEWAFQYMGLKCSLRLGNNHGRLIPFSHIVMSPMGCILDGWMTLKPNSLRSQHSYSQYIFGLLLPLIRQNCSDMTRHDWEREMVKDRQMTPGQNQTQIPGFMVWRP